MEDTICAIATAQGVGAISIIRMSGKESINILSKIFHGKDVKELKSHTIHYGFIYDGEEKIDEVMVSIMLSPKSYTTENIVEINSHGGVVTTNKILEILLKNGARLAEPGEFTKRAFLNGRIDLTQAEAVNDLITSKTDSARKLALSTMGGLLKKKIREIREKIVSVMANIEVNIDYPEYEDIQEVTKDNLMPKLKDIKECISELLKDTENSKIIKEGINIAIVGKPNVGKSSLLNSFLDEEKAIVTDIAGTTRDIVEGSINLNGFLINFIDTAGIRNTEDVVEKIGVEKSYYAISYADIVIIVLDSTSELSSYEKELIDSIPSEKRIIFVNKSDLNSEVSLDYDYLIGNTLSKSGIKVLENEIEKRFKLDKLSSSDMTYISNARQKNLLLEALKCIENAINNLDNGMPVSIIEIDITTAWNLLGEITGDNYQNELLDTLFSNFCLGK